MNPISFNTLGKPNNLNSTEKILKKPKNVQKDGPIHTLDEESQNSIQIDLSRVAENESNMNRIQYQQELLESFNDDFDSSSSSR
jgi:hypothetical protein